MIDRKPLVRVFMKFLPVCLSACLVLGCDAKDAAKSQEGAASQGDSGNQLVTIRYGIGPDGPFEIVGTDVKGVKLADLPSILCQHKAGHPEAEYEVFAEVKRGTEESNAVIKTIRGTGVNLRHYWAPVSGAPTGVNAQWGPYGVGYLDILESERAGGKSLAGTSKEGG